MEENLITKNGSLVASTSYYHDSLTWCVQKSIPVPPWKKVFYLCPDPLVIGSFTILLFIAIGFTYFCEEFEHHPKWDWNRLAFNGVNYYLGFASAYNPKTTANRTCYIFCSFGAMIFVCLLSSILVQLFISPILIPQIQNVQEIIDGEFKLIGNKFAFQKIVLHNEVNVYI